MKHNRADYQNAIRGPESPMPRDEPVFLLRGQDLCAPAALRFWAPEAGKHGADERTVQAALQVAGEMEAWSTKKTAGNAL